MISSQDFSRLRRAAPGVAVAFHAVCSFIACATVVEEPASTTNVDPNSGLVSTTGSATSATNSTTNSAQTANTQTTSTVSVTSSTAATATSSATSGDATTSTNTASSTTTATTAASTTTANATVSTTTGTSSAGGAGGATTGSFATTVTDGAGGSSSSETTITNSTTGGTDEYCDDPLTPTENVAVEGTTGAFDTTDGVCYRLDFVPADFAGWGCSNFAASSGNRTILVNGTSVTCGELPLPEPVDGGYYFEFGPGTNVSAAVYWWNWE